MPQREFLAEGRHPIIDQGQQLVAGYCNTDDRLCTTVPAIVFGDHTRCVKFVEKPFAAGADGVKILVPTRENDNLRYLYHALRSANIPSLGYSRHFKLVKELSFVVPEREQQDKVVELLDAVEYQIAAAEDQLDKLDELVKSRFVEMFGSYGEEGFVPLKDVCSIITDGTHQPPKFYADGIPFLFVSNIANDVLTYETGKYIAEEDYKTLIKRTPIEVGDVLVSAVGSFGHPAVVREERPFCFQRHIAYLKPIREMIDSDYLHAALLTEHSQRYMDQVAKGVAQRTVTLKSFKELRIPLPPHALQQEFAAFVQQVDKLKFETQQAIDKLQMLYDSLAQEYFAS